ncbi:unnamed protein product [Closterium sp. Naga37s-1]|nr:unnamed protein product [Closterium sp. Naga37s-1]
MRRCGGSDSTGDGDRHGDRHGDGHENCNSDGAIKAALASLLTALAPQSLFPSAQSHASDRPHSAASPQSHSRAPSSFLPALPIRSHTPPLSFKSHPPLSLHSHAPPTSSPSLIPWLVFQDDVIARKVRLVARSRLTGPLLVEDVALAADVRGYLTGAGNPTGGGDPFTGLTGPLLVEDVALAADGGGNPIGGSNRVAANSMIPVLDYSHLTHKYLPPILTHKFPLAASALEESEQLLLKGGSTEANPPPVSPPCHHLEPDYSHLTHKYVPPILAGFPLAAPALEGRDQPALERDTGEGGRREGVRVLVLGGGAFTLPMYLNAHRPDYHIQASRVDRVVEIDALMHLVAQRLFGLASRGLDDSEKERKVWRPSNPRLASPKSRALDGSEERKGRSDASMASSGVGHGGMRLKWREERARRREERQMRKGREVSKGRENGGKREREKGAWRNRRRGMKGGIRVHIGDARQYVVCRFWSHASEHLFHRECERKGWKPPRRPRGQTELSSFRPVLRWYWGRLIVPCSPMHAPPIVFSSAPSPLPPPSPPFPPVALSLLPPCLQEARAMALPLLPPCLQELRRQGRVHSPARQTASLSAPCGALSSSAMPAGAADARASS